MRSLVLLALAFSSPAFAQGQILLVCNLAGGGTVSVIATESSKKVDLEMDDTGKMQLGAASARGLAATMESEDPGSIAGPVDLVEIGRGWNSSEGACGLGLELNTRNQRLGRDRDIPLKPEFSYNKAECGKDRAEIESCSLGENLPNINALKKFIHTEVAD
jgi:hypothetical protein